MSYKKVLTIQDISCVGQCSLTVALPIISACGVETCVLPSAVLSTHTGGFSGFTFADLTEEMPKIKEHWSKEGINFDCIYTGYLGSNKQIEYVKDLFSILQWQITVICIMGLIMLSLKKWHHFVQKPITFCQTLPRLVL